jgi:hypothetical protein
MHYVARGYLNVPVRFVYELPNGRRNFCRLQRGEDVTKEACFEVSGFLGRAHLARGDWLALGLFENASAFRASGGPDA